MEVAIKPEERVYLPCYFLSGRNIEECQEKKKMCKMLVFTTVKQ